MLFDWDPAKAASNVLKHDVGFEDARTVFDDPLFRIESDPDHSVGEERLRATGQSRSGKLLVVSFTDDGDITRLISARAATRGETRRYAEER